VSGSSVALAAAAALILLLAALAWRHRLASGQLIPGAAAAALAVVAVLVPALHGQAVPVEAPVPTTSIWRPFNATVLRDAVAQGHIVFVDVTAAWCLNCKVNELAVLDRDPVASRLRDSDVVAMRSDWTRPDPSVTAYLQSFGRYGVPLNVVYGPRAPDGIALPELLTTDAVMDAVQRATAGPVRQQEATE
jgi:suppressor for copper-sensitivity B